MADLFSEEWANSPETWQCGAIFGHLAAKKHMVKKPGEWNRYEITADGHRITVVLNGKQVNDATDCDVRPGKIGLQSEGGVIHFRTVALTRL